MVLGVQEKFFIDLKKDFMLWLKFKYLFKSFSLILFLDFLLSLFSIFLFLYLIILFLGQDNGNKVL